ncbi:hypothetical protein Neosp_000253 [[Neocosmospora] mangrovei]
MGQNRVALTILSDFVKESKDDPACFVVISPYKSNVELINRLRKDPEYAALAGMADAVTVDSFQGQEGDIAVVVIRTTGCWNKKKGKGMQMVTFGANGEDMYVRGDALRNMYQTLMDGSRVVNIAMRFGIDPLRHIGLGSATVTIDSAFTNMAMKSFAVDDWDQLREILRHVPPFRRGHASLSEKI